MTESFSALCLQRVILGNQMPSIGVMHCQVGMAADNPVFAFLNYKMFFKQTPNEVPSCEGGTYVEL